MRLWPLQVCQAHRADGGRVVVVMSQREKLDMEALYRCGGRGVSIQKLACESTCTRRTSSCLCMPAPQVQWVSVALHWVSGAQHPSQQSSVNNPMALPSVS